MAPELAPWDPAGPTEVQRLFSRQPAPWWVAGGYAVELAAGRRLREHEDIDVLLLRRSGRQSSAARAQYADRAG